MVNMLLVFFLDFSKAFDTVDHKSLLDKLDHYGIGSCALSWFKRYFSRRLQYVTYNGSQSSQQMIKCGVPQRSILGPLLFLICINDLCIACKSTEPVLFADDTNLFSIGSNAISLQDGVNNDLTLIVEWLKVNKLSLNIKKTHFMCFSVKDKSRPGIYIYKLMGKPLLKSINQNFWVWLLTINWVGKIISHLCVERSHVVSGL